MPDLPASVGALHVTGTLVSGLADSSDAGTQPDYAPNVGTVTFDAIDERGQLLTRPIAVPSEGLLMTVRGIPAGLDSAGRIVAPMNGQSGSDAQVTPGIYLIAPNQGALALVGWRWRATASPSPGQGWAPFTVIFSGEPGDEIDLSAASLVASTATLVQQPVVWTLDSTDPLPPTARLGQFIYYQDTGDFYLIGA